MKSQQTTNSYFLSGQKTKNQSSTINLNIQQLERGELIVQFSSDSETESMELLDVDEKIDINSVNDSSMINS